MSFKRAVLMSGLCASVGGCATLFTGTNDVVSISSTPPDALIYIDGVELGRTPATLTIQRSLNEKRVTLKLNGYDDQTFVLSRRFNLMSILNLTNLLCWGVDMVSGAVWESSQPSYSFTLRQRQAMADALGVEKVLLVTELDRDADGVRVVPDGEVAVVDDDSGNVVVFTSH